MPAARALRVAAIRFVNAIPLVYGLQKASTIPDHPEIELCLETPSVCFQKLVCGEVDVALVPVIGTQMHPQIRLLKGLGIAATNKTESVYLFAKKPLDHVRSVLTDPASLTSVILLKIVFREKYRHMPEFQSGPIVNIHEALRTYDAALVIGDDAILIEKSDYDHYDLAAEWYSVTGFPFVFAVWGANRSLTDTEKQIFQSAYLRVSENLDEICNCAEAILPVDRAFFKRYYNDNLHYQLTRSDYEGLLRFLSFAAELHFIDKVRKDIWL